MTTNEIKTLIQNTIAGQGSQVDIGGKLAEILGAIVDAIPANLVVDITDVLTEYKVEISQELFSTITKCVAIDIDGARRFRTDILPDGMNGTIAAYADEDVDEFVLFGTFILDGVTFASGSGYAVYCSSLSKYYILSIEV